MKRFVGLVGVLICLVLFNLSYFSKSGLLVFNFSNAKKINYKNSFKHIENFPGKRSLSSFRMEKFMSEERAFEIVQKVRKQKNNWVRRNAAMSTLGTASYLDGGDKDIYEKMSIESNPFMIEHYNELLDDVLNYFQERCPDAKVKYRENAALPGFHVFHCNSLFSMRVASVHKDLQYQRLKFTDEEEIDSEYTMSFTLALELPDSGAGLYTFDSPDLGIFHYLIPPPLIHTFASKTRIDYKVGWMVVHNGMTFHMISPCKEDKKKKRITLQGHGVYEKNANTWWLYW